MNLQNKFFLISDAEKIGLNLYRILNIPAWLIETFLESVSWDIRNALSILISVSRRITRGISQRKGPHTFAKKVLMTVRYLVSQETVHELSDRFGVTKHSFIRSKRQIIQTMCDANLLHGLGVMNSELYQQDLMRWVDINFQIYPGTRCSSWEPQTNSGSYS